MFNNFIEVSGDFVDRASPVTNTSPYNPVDTNLVNHRLICGIHQP